MIAFNNMCVTLGQLVSYSLGAGFTEVLHGWRFLVAVGGIPPIVLACLLPFCPETPRQLISRSKIEEAKRVIAKVYPHATPEQVEGKAMHIQNMIQDEAQIMADKTLWWQFKQLHRVPANLRALICACTVMASKYSRVYFGTRNLLTSCNSFPTWRIQYAYVLLWYTVWARWIRKAHSSVTCCRRYQLYLLCL